MTREFPLTKPALAVLSLALLAACGGGGSADGGGGGDNPDVIETPSEMRLDNRGATGEVTVTYLLLQGDTPQAAGTSEMTYATGAFTGGALDGTDLDNAGIYLTNADTEFARLVSLSGTQSLFGVAGIAAAVADLPAAGTSTTYSAGWVSLLVTTDSETYTLTGDAALTADWGSGAALDATFSNFTGTDSRDASVSGLGNLTLDGMVISGNSFADGVADGTGIFAVLDGASDTDGTQGLFFGPNADEVGGLIVIRDPDLDATGAFLAD